jgi:anti-sigma factor RsiW
MNHHPTDLQLRAFAEASIGAAEAVELAAHIDACPACSARVAALDPLTSAFLGAPSPTAPVGMVGAALARAAEGSPERSTTWPGLMWVGGALLAAAGTLALPWGAKLGAQIGAQLGFWLTLLDRLHAPVAGSALWVGVALAAATALLGGLVGLVKVEARWR